MANEYKDRLTKIYLSQAKASAPYSNNPVKGVGYVGGGLVSLQPPNITYPSGSYNASEAIAIKHHIKNARAKTGGYYNHRYSVPAHIPGDYSEYIHRVSMERMYENAKNFIPIAAGTENVVDQSDFLAHQAEAAELPRYASDFKDYPGVYPKNPLEYREFYTRPEEIPETELFETVYGVELGEKEPKLAAEYNRTRSESRAGYTPETIRANVEYLKKIHGKGFVRDTSKQTSAPARAIKTKPESKTQRQIENLNKQLARAEQQQFLPINYPGISAKEREHNTMVAQAQRKAYSDLKKQFITIKEREKLKELFKYL
jgi:hypothetical protein